MNYSELTEFIVFYKINNHFVLIDRSDNAKHRVFSMTELQELEPEKRYDSNWLNTLFKSQIFQGYYTYKYQENIVYFERFSIKNYLRNIVDSTSIYNKCKSIISNFRHNQKENLLTELLSTDSNIFSVMEAFKKYTFSCHFSLWNYDSEFEIFTCLASSFLEPGVVITKNTPSTLLDSVNGNNDSIETRIINDDSPIFNQLRTLGVKYLNRIIVPYGTNKTSVVSFYSKNNNFSFNSSLQTRISQGIKNELNVISERSHEMYERFAKSVEIHLEQDTVHGYANRFLIQLCEYFDLYSAGVYYFDDESINEISTYGSINNETGMISAILNGLKSKENLIIHNRNQTLNSPVSEITEDEPIKFVLVRSFKLGKLKLCLVVTKNLDNSQVTVKLPYVNDHDSMERVSDFLQFNMQLLAVKTDIINELEQAANFMKVWRHEIRSPISKFNLGSDLIKLLLSKADLKETTKRKVNIQLDEIKLLGNRLKQLTDVYSFDAILDQKNKEKERVSILRDVVLPIVNTSKDYAQKQHSIEFIVDHHSFTSVYLLSDIKLLNMVLNALIDNAMKYSRKDSDIVKIYGHRVDEFFAISIANKGVPICNDETEHIFSNGVRGENAIGQNIDGTGVGLFIAKSVMETLGGHLKLTSNVKDNIEFTMFILNERV